MFNDAFKLSNKNSLSNVLSQQTCEMIFSRFASDPD